MNKFIFLIVFAMSTFSISAQSSSKTEAEIRGLEQRVQAAILSGDTNTLKELWAPEFLVNTPRNQATGTRDSILLIQKAGMIDYSIFEKILERIQFQKNIVITMGYEKIIPRNDSPGMKAGQVYKRRFTNIWMKKKGKWQQVARHASIICQ